MSARCRAIAGLALVALAALIGLLPLRIAAGWLFDGSGLTARRAHHLSN